ncbi:MAG: hypothetical protein RBT70_04995 [Alphaproteobacteria bacterium]|jgi:hypothetical protein|nr:hypothetical protein [Alphaproteobacteria bacterium]
MNKPATKKTTLINLFKSTVAHHCHQRTNQIMATYGMLIGIWDLTENEKSDRAQKLIKILNTQFQNNPSLIRTEEKYIYKICDTTHNVLVDLTPKTEMAKIASCAYAMSFARIIQTMKAAPIGEKRLERNYMLGLIHLGWENRYMYSLSYDMPNNEKNFMITSLRKSPHFPGHTIQ